MPRKKIYFLFCFTVLSLVGFWWYIPFSIEYEHQATRHKVVLQDDKAIMSSTSFSSAQAVVLRNLADPCMDTKAEASLLSQLQGRMYCSNQAHRSYTSQFPIFNTALTINPKLTITPFHIEDIILALKIATTHNLTVTVRNGGHNPAGFALNEGGLVIDMAYLRGIQFVSESSNPDWDGYDKDYVIAQGGALWTDVYTRLAEREKSERPLAVVGGGCASVGVVGLALGGGIAWFSRSRGLVSDNMLAARILFPNGTLSLITDSSHPEFLWALRGAGGSNFGVITEVLLRTFPAEDKYLAGTFVLMRHPDDAADLINLYADQILHQETDSRLTVDFFVSLRLHTKNLSMLYAEISLFFDGTIEEGLKAAKPFLNTLSGQLTVGDACKMHSKLCVSSDGITAATKLAIKWLQNGGPFLHNHTFSTWERSFGLKHADVFWTSGFFEKWTTEATEDILKTFKATGIDKVPNGIELFFYVTFEHCGGQMGKGPSLWKHKNSTGLVSVQSFLMASEKDKMDPLKGYPSVKRQAKLWLDWFYQKMSPHFSSSYANYAHREMENWQEKYYGIENYNKLVKIKSKIEGTHIFNSLQRIGNTSIESEEVEEVDFTHMEYHRLDRDSFESRYTLLCPDWIIDHALTVTPPDIFPISSASKRWSGPKAEADDDDAKRKVVLLTGGSGGIGFSAVLNLLGLGVNVIATSQSESKCKEIESKIDALFKDKRLPPSPTGHGNFICFDLILNDFQSVESFVKETKSFLGEEEDSYTIDSLILNAAEYGFPATAKNAGGLSKTLVVNHLGHFYLTMLLLQEELLSISGRIIIQGSGSALYASEEKIMSLLEANKEPVGQTDITENSSNSNTSMFETPEFQTHAASKALNAIFALEFHRRLQRSSTLRKLQILLSLPPGTVETLLTRNIFQNPSYKEEILEISTFISPAEGALSCVYAAMEEIDNFNKVVSAGNSTRKLEWEYKKQPMGVQYVAGCESGSIASQFRTADWLKTGTTCRLWNWGINTINSLRNETIDTNSGLLSELTVPNCDPQ